MNRLISVILILSFVLLNSACLDLLLPRLSAPFVVVDEKTGEKMIVISSTGLAGEYGEDKESADRNYKGKLLKVTGKVGDIINDNGSVTVKFVGDNGWRAVYCHIREDSVAALKLKKKTSATLIGIGDGIADEVIIKVKECRAE